MNEEVKTYAYKNSKEIDYKFWDEFKDYGSYKIVVTDKHGNT